MQTPRVASGQDTEGGQPLLSPLSTPFLQHVQLLCSMFTCFCSMFSCSVLLLSYAGAAQKGFSSYQGSKGAMSCKETLPSWAQRSLTLSCPPVASEERCRLWVAQADCAQSLMLIAFLHCPRSLGFTSTKQLAFGSLQHSAITQDFLHSSTFSSEAHVFYAQWPACDPQGYLALS